MIIDVSLANERDGKMKSVGFVFYLQLFVPFARPDHESAHCTSVVRHTDRPLCFEMHRPFFALFADVLRELCGQKLRFSMPSQTVDNDRYFRRTTLG